MQMKSSCSTEHKKRRSQVFAIEGRFIFSLAFSSSSAADPTHLPSAASDCLGVNAVKRVFKADLLT